MEGRTRPLNLVLLRITLLLVLLLGTTAALVQVWIDLKQEKEGVESAASEFLSSVAPSAASAAYNFYDQAAEQVVEGLFTQRAIAGVKIVNEGETMIARTRNVVPTLPPVGNFTVADEVTLERALHIPPEFGTDQVIGSISIVVDRSVVPPAIVNRMFAYFLLAILKNSVLGILLVALVYGALTRYVISLADAAERWTPGTREIDVPRPPKFLLGTEVELLGSRIGQLADTASGAIREIEASHDAVVLSNSELSLKSKNLSEAVENRTAELEQANAKLRSLAECDGLTGLNNRRFFDQRAKELLRSANKSGRSIAVLLIDVDHFKSYNDYYGHQAGDKVLTKLANILKSVSEDCGCFLARYGGEEFVILCSDESVINGENVASKIHTALKSESIEHQRSSTASRLTVSIGVCSSQNANMKQCEDIDPLVSAADEALYEAKQRGRNQTVNSTREIRSRVKAQRLAARSLLEAIDARQFEPFFQPQVDAGTNSIVGAEALVRWRKESGSIAAPTAFLEAANESGLIPLIDRMMLEKISDTLREVSECGLNLPRVSLNATVDDISDKDYVSTIVALADSSKTRIAVELLETAFFDAPSDVLKWELDRLREARVEIEIDDFGTGRTSILGLMSISPNRLKIAKELVLPLGENPHHCKVVASVIEIAKALDVEVLAEGVETAEIAEILVGLGCPMQQGFYHGRPIPVDEFVATLRGSDGQSQAAC